MWISVISGIVALPCMSGCELMSSLTGCEMMDAVNDRLPRAEQLGVLGWHFSKTRRLLRTYARLYPNGNLAAKFWMFAGLTLLSLVISAWSFKLLGN
jgi:hypothetical protein